MLSTKIEGGNDVGVWLRSWGLDRQARDKSFFVSHLEPSSYEEDLTDALSELPTPYMVNRLVELMRPKELREFTEGMLNDSTEAVKRLQPLLMVNTINDWIATAEEMVTNRRSRRYILAAKARADALVGGTE